MTCREAMTVDPICCTPNDTASRAAQIMRSEDVGPVPVVSDQYEKRLLGIVTDRDLALKIVSEGRDPNTTPISSVMTHDPVTCSGDENIAEAVSLMSENQIRRIPIVDDDGRLIGIISQADIARMGPDDEVGELVEEISEPAGIGRSLSRGLGMEPGRHSAGSIAGGLLMGATCMALGAGLMYILDPNRGRTRRALARDKALSLYNHSGQFLRKTQRDMSNRATGIVAQAKSLARHPSIPDEKLAARARSVMGRIVSHPHAINITAQDGCLRVEGPILAEEANSFIRSVQSIPGVKSVENRLELHQEKDIPELQGGVKRPGQKMEFMQANWSPAARTLAGAVGSGLALYGLATRTATGLASGAAGLGLLARGISNREVATLTDVFRRKSGSDNAELLRQDRSGLLH